jgi:hypothetical protein
MMSEVIRLMESLAQAPAWLDAADYAGMVDSLNIENEQHAALMERDVSALIESMGLKASMFCMVLTPDGGEEQEERQDDDDQGSDQPDEQSAADR